MCAILPGTAYTTVNKIQRVPALKEIIAYVEIRYETNNHATKPIIAQYF